ncbi:transcription factor VIP1 [Dendrobium catenatum]|uniref:Transcription factor VIP1 n=1 Tax=Dendrobium catenatum TaxID=906689 RepID=A0A2I0WQG8_9ASPA|nr:transcription factor VIP1 [Dendrobium catenatum]PKU77922.1 Transcription factor VIP1 [Dendrobium catenatum]
MDSNRPPETLQKNQRFAGGRIPPNPRSSGHRRAQSESFFRLPDEFLFDSDHDFNFPDFDFPSVSEDISGSRSAAAAAIPADSSGMPKSLVVQPVARPSGGGAHLRSLSLDTAFFDGLCFEGLGAISGSVPEKKPQHQHSGSTDGATSSFEEESMMPSTDYSKAADKLAKLALIDPKRAKRILANRQSAARSKERKVRHTSELERKVQTLQTEATTLLAQLTLLQRDSTGLTSENTELKLRLQSMEQEAHLSDALNEALREEVQRLKSQAPNSSGNTFSLGFQQSSSPYFPHFPNQQTQQIHSGILNSHLNQLLNSASSPAFPNGQAFNDQNVHDSMDLM